MTNRMAQTGASYAGKNPHTFFGVSYFSISRVM